MIFFKKKHQLNSEEFDILHAKMVEIQGEMAGLKAKLAIFGTDFEDLRGRLNRKIMEKYSTPGKDETKNINTSPPAKSFNEYLQQPIT